ncbi:MAG: hypothetical protein Q8920_11675 [Bacillota bacterium]|nr:hypothetical protein [Bacillota bacterium]
MKRHIALIFTLIAAISILATGCGSSSTLSTEQNSKTLTDCLALTQNVDSVEADMITKSEADGQSININMNMKIEDMKKDIKCQVAMDSNGKKQELYLSVIDGKATVYTKDESGKYTATSADASFVGDIDVTKSYNAYIDIIKKNADWVTSTGKKSYLLTIPKDKSAEIYEQITGNSTNGTSLDSLKIEFLIGDDSYLKTIKLTTIVGTVKVSVDTNYYNYNKKFNIVIPQV